MARTQVFVTLELLRIISEFYHRQHHLRVSCLQVSVDIRNRQRALHSSGDSKHAWTLCSRCYTDNRACSCWDLQSLLVVSETWGCNLVQSINRQTPLFTIVHHWRKTGLKYLVNWSLSQMIWSYRKRSKRLYLHTRTSNFTIYLGLRRPIQSWN